jgi:hypothetical protein
MAKTKTSYGRGLGASENRNLKELKCRSCETKVEKVDYRATAVLCFRCTAHLCNPKTKFSDEQ